MNSQQDRTLGSAKAPPIVKTANEAREGVTGHNVRRVLGFGLVGIIVALAVVYALSFVWH